MNEAFFASLTDEQKRLSWFYHMTFVRAGARLDASSKKRVAAINETLAGLFTRFFAAALAIEMLIAMMLVHWANGFLVSVSGGKNGIEFVLLHGGFRGGLIPPYTGRQVPRGAASPSGTDDAPAVTTSGRRAP